ncbi:putative nuclease HARBI1 [Amyelois transitella]|nr:putative nuclease HARBI1 [Amyelois transitella]
MPGCLACIDGTHVAIVCPHEHEERFYNRKGYHSLNVQIVCDANLNILNVDSSYPGSTHDSVIWANHPLNPYLERLHTVSGEDLYLLGDSGYPLRPIMMTPVSDSEPDTPEDNYQNMHLTARNTVERCIGVLKGRFRCLLGDRKLHYSPTVAAKITNACCVLHNIANRHNLPFQPLTSAEAEAERRRQEGASGSMPGTGGGASVLSQLELGSARR